MNNTKQEKKEKAKKIAKKVLDVICYIFSALFILLMSVVALQSCKTASGTSAEGLTQSVPNLSSTKWRFNEHIDASGVRGWSVDFELESGTRYYGFDLDSGELGYLDNDDNVYTAYANVWEDDNYRTIVFYGSYDSYNYDNATLIAWLEDNALQVNVLEKFTFNKAFNYNAPLGISLGQQFGGNVSQAQQTIAGGIYRFILNTGLFYSNGSFFDAIVIDYLNAGVCTFDIGGILRNGTQDNLAYFALGYRRAGQSTIDFINYRDNLVGYKENATLSYMTTSSTWINDEYRFITLYSTLNNDTRVKLNGFNNNNQNAYNGSSVGNEVNNVFTLVASAFTGLIPILGVYLLPGITLGTLLFLPLVAMLVFVIIKTIKK